MELRNIVGYNIKKIESTEFFQSLQKKLKEDKWYKPAFDYSEKITNVNRVYIATGLGSLLIATLFYRFGIHFICAVVGFLYPGYQTIEALEKSDDPQIRRWLTYWLVFSVYNFLEIFLFFLHWLPGYWIVKCIFYVWCYVPLQTNGSDVVYSLLIRPLFKRNQEAIDEAIDHLMKSAQNICSEPNLDKIDVALKHLD